MNTRIDCIIEAHDILSLSPLAAEILHQLKFWKRRTVTDLVHRTQESPSTIRQRLRELVRDGYARRHGKGKSTWYTL